jgi:EAL domain-containing protein (putative c-di-GMP-specific phosphodiesterase class I)
LCPGADWTDEWFESSTSDADQCRVSLATPATSTEGVRLLSHRPSVLFKVEPYATEPCDGDVSVEGVVISGPGWEDKLRHVLTHLGLAESAFLWAVRLDDEVGLPLPAERLLARARTDWFPKFLSQGQMTPVFQPIVDLRTGRVYGREALIRGRMGRTEVRGAELVQAAEVHDALFTFDTRTRAAALEVGLPALAPGELLFTKLDPRGVIDVESSLRSVWPLVERAGALPQSVGLELMGAERHPDMGLLAELASAHRAKGAVISVDDLSAGTDTLRVIEGLKPTIVKLSRHLCKGIETSPARRHLVGALVEVAHELGCRVVAVGIERDSELEHIQELGIDLGQGFYLGQPTAEMLPVEARLIVRSLT